MQGVRAIRRRATAGFQPIEGHHPRGDAVDLDALVGPVDSPAPAGVFATAPAACWAEFGEVRDGDVLVDDRVVGPLDGS
jgi:hypothetical protein